jgi:hypothetical protein
MQELQRNRIPKWLQGMVAPTVMLWLCMLSIAIAPAIAISPMRPLADIISRNTFSFILAWWVIADARKRRRELWYDFGTFVFFAWPVVVPIYLFKTRGMRGFLTLLCFAGLVLFTVGLAFVLQRSPS